MSRRSLLEWKTWLFEGFYFLNSKLKPAATCVSHTFLLIWFKNCAYSSRGKIVAQNRSSPSSFEIAASLPQKCGKKGKFSARLSFNTNVVREREREYTTYTTREREWEHTRCRENHPPKPTDPQTRQGYWQNYHPKSTQQSGGCERAGPEMENVVAVSFAQPSNIFFSIFNLIFLLIFLLFITFKLQQIWLNPMAW